MLHVHVNASSYIWIIRVSNGRVASHIPSHIPRSRTSCCMCISMSHVSYEWVVPGTNESCLISSVMVVISHLHINSSCHIRISHVSYEWVMSHLNELCFIWMSHVSYEWVMSHLNESCLISIGHVRYVVCAYQWVILYMNECCLVRTSHVSYQ